MKHDEICLALTDDVLKELLVPAFGELGCWSKWHGLVDIPMEQWKHGTRELFNCFDQEYSAFSHERTSGEIIAALARVRDSVAAWKNHPVSERFELQKTFEFPLIKGEGQYKVTRGFIDMIVRMRAVPASPFFTPYKNYNNIEFVVEIKTASDFKDIGQILRQINEYREYYEAGAKRWNPYSGAGECEKRVYCILSDALPAEDSRGFFKGGGIMCLELNGGKHANQK